MKERRIATQDTTAHISEPEIVSYPDETQRLERDGSDTASPSGMDYPGSVTVPDFTPYRNGKGCVSGFFQDMQAYVLSDLATAC